MTDSAINTPQDLVRLAKSIGVCTTLAKLIAIGDTTAFSDLTKRIDEAVIALPKAAATIARLQGEIGGRDAMLKVLRGHIAHMAEFIARKKLGYSFEGLGEDMPDIDAALNSADGGRGE